MLMTVSPSWIRAITGTDLYSFASILDLLLLSTYDVICFGFATMYPLTRSISVRRSTSTAFWATFTKHVVVDYEMERVLLFAFSIAL